MSCFANVERIIIKIIQCRFLQTGLIWAMSCKSKDLPLTATIDVFNFLHLGNPASGAVMSYSGVSHLHNLNTVQIEMFSCPLMEVAHIIWPWVSDEPDNVKLCIHCVGWKETAERDKSEGLEPGRMMLPSDKIREWRVKMMMLVN